MGIVNMDAKDRIAAYFREHDGEEIDAADIGKALDIDIMTAIGLMDELEAEGKIKCMQ